MAQRCRSARSSGSGAASGCFGRRGERGPRARPLGVALGPCHHDAAGDQQQQHDHDQDERSVVGQVVVLRRWAGRRT